MKFKQRTSVNRIIILRPPFFPSPLKYSLLTGGPQEIDGGGSRGPMESEVLILLLPSY